MDKAPENWNIQDFSQLNETIETIREMTRPITEALGSFQEALRPLAEAVAQYKFDFSGLQRAMAEAFRPIIAIEKMGEAQFVYWDYMTADFVDGIIASDNIDKTLNEYICRKRYKKVNDTIERSCAAPSVQKHLRLYDQSVKAYKNGCSDLAVTGFASLLDGLLADVSKNPTHKLQPRIDIIKSKLEKEEFLDQDEYAMLTLAVTFEKTLDSFSAPSDFRGIEPKGLNRHWIAHGRSLRKKTKLDCVKMINLIYGLLLIEELDAAAPIEPCK